MLNVVLLIINNRLKLVDVNENISCQNRVDRLITVGFNETLLD